MAFHRRYRSLSFNSMEGHLEGGEYIYIYILGGHIFQWVKISGSSFGMTTCLEGVH